MKIDQKMKEDNLTVDSKTLRKNVERTKSQRQRILGTHYLLEGQKTSYRKSSKDPFPRNFNENKKNINNKVPTDFYD